MEKKRIFKNDTKITQIYYNRTRDPIELKPGETYVEDLSGVIDVNELIKRERDRRAIEMDVDEAKTSKKTACTDKGYEVA